MTNADRENRERFIAHLMTTAEKNGKSLSYEYAEWLAKYLHSKEVSLSNLAVKCCDDPRFNEKDEKKQSRLEELVRNEIKKSVGCKVSFNHDPRGYCIRLYLLDYRSRKWATNWDGETASTNW